MCACSGYFLHVRLILSAAVSAVAVALGVAAFAVPYMRKHRQWDTASPETRDAIRAGARERQIGIVALVVVTVCAVLAVRALS
jgi:hypothetical protein